MTDKEILEQAIQKAIDGGWRGDMLDIKVKQQDNGIVRVYWDNTEWSVLDILYNKAFAKALWNTPMHSTTEVNFYTASGLSEWQYHLQQMVISDDPIQYLKENM